MANIDYLETYFKQGWSHYFIFGCAILSIVWGLINVLIIRNIDITDPEPIKAYFEEEQAAGINDDEAEGKDSETLAADVIKELAYIGGLITDGAIQFLWAEYFYLTLFCLAFALVIGFTVDATEMARADSPSNFPYTAVSFLIGASTSILAGYIGMRIAVFTNSRTTYQCCKGEMQTTMIPESKLDEVYLDQMYRFHDITDRENKVAEAELDKNNTVWVEGQVKDLKDGFMTAFQGGQVLGFTLVGLALLILEVILLVYKSAWFDVVLNKQLEATTD